MQKVMFSIWSHENENEKSILKNWNDFSAYSISIKFDLPTHLAKIPFEQCLKNEAYYAIVALLHMKFHIQNRKKHGISKQ
jgi:hypothetical protein